MFACTTALECMLELGFMTGVLLLGSSPVEIDTVQVRNG